MTDNDIKRAEERGAKIIAERDTMVVSLIETLGDYLLTGSGDYEAPALRLAALNQVVDSLPIIIDGLKKQCEPRPVK